MNDPGSMSEVDLNRLLGEAAGHAEFLRDWADQAASIDAMLDAEGCPDFRSEVTPAEGGRPRPRPVPDGWTHAIAVSTGGIAGVRPAGSVPELARKSTSDDWWTVRYAIDGAGLYVGTPARLVVQSDSTGVVSLPEGRLRGTVLYSSADVAVVRLLPQNTREGPS